MAADLEFRIGAELSEIKGALASLRADFTKVGTAAQQAGGNQAFKGVETGARSALGAVGRLVAGFVTLAGIIRTIGAADELNTLNARLRLVTNGTEEFNRAQVALFDLAQRTRSGLGETVKLYAQIANATKDAKVGQEVLLEVVETVNQAVQLSGSSTQAAEAALVQLGQGLASGTLRGEELNSVLEQTPALADAIAKGMGITRGELRKYGEDGKITAQQVIEALQKQRDEVARQFAQLPLTVGQAVTLLKNAGLQLVGAFDTASGATSGVARVIKDLADFLSSDEVVGAVIEFAATWSNAFEQIVGDVQEARRIIAEATRGITGDGETIFDFIGRAFRELPANVRAAVRIATVNVAAFVDSTITSFGGLADYIRAVFDPNVTVEQVRERLLRAQASIEQARRESVDEALADRDKAIADAKKAREDAIKARETARQARPGGRSRGNFVNRPSAEALRQAEQERKAQLDAFEKLEKDSADRQLSILSELFEDGKLAAADYYRRREELELQALDRAIAVEQRRAAGGGADRIKAEAEIELLERRKTDITLKASRDRRLAEQALARELDDLRAQDLENQGKTAEAAGIRLQAQFADLRRKLVQAGNTEGVALIDRLIDTGRSKARFDEIKAQFDKVIADLQARQQAIANQQQTGAIPAETAVQQQAEAQQVAIAKLGALNAQLQALAADPNALPAVKQAAEEANAAFVRLQIDGLTGLDRAIVDLRASLANLQAGFAQATVGAGVDALTNLFTDLASGAKSGKEAVIDFVRSFAQSMAQLAARALATFLVLQTLDAIYPGLAKAAAAGMSVGANVKHGGGMAGHGTRRQVPSWVFAGAPRFHNGGMVGLKPGEVPAILQEGERVQSRSEVAASKGSGGGSGYRIVNVIDPNLVGDYMTSAAGERTILNVIEKNAGAVRQKIGS